MEQEIWKIIEDYPMYEVSNLGKVRKISSGKLLKQCLDSKGYPSVNVNDGKKATLKVVHRFVAKAFMPNPENKPYIDHIDTDVHNFSLSNLRWVTAKENSNNPLTLQHCRENTYTEDRTAKINEKRKSLGILVEVYQYTKDGLFVAKYDSMHQAQIKTGIYSTQIKFVLNDNTQSAGGYMWFTKPQHNIKYKKRPHPKAREVVLTNDIGEEIKRWEMLKDAAAFVGATADNVRKAIKEKRKVKGFMLKYAETTKRIEPTQ